MPNVDALSAAADLQADLRKNLGHAHVSVKPYGDHLLIQMAGEDKPDTIARLTALDRSTYGAAFRNGSGRWEPLPGTGSRKEMAELVVTLLGPYLQP
jgi:hypothetical protein